MSNTTIKFLGHTTVQIDTAATKLIIDPNFSKSIAFIKRHDEPVIDPAELQKVNLILVSNAHLNRMDKSSYKYFKTSSTFLLPKGLKTIVDSYLNFDFHEMEPDQEYIFGDCKITALKNLHFGRRYTGFGLNSCLNYLIQTPDKTFFYGSDSEYGPFYSEIGNRFKIDVAILPIDFVGPEILCHNRYLTPFQAVQAFLDLKAEKMIPNAFGSFVFGKRKIDLSLDLLRQEVSVKNLQERVCILKTGESL